MDGRERQRLPPVGPELRLFFGDARLQGTASGLQGLHPVAGGVVARGTEGEDGSEDPVALGLVGSEVRSEGLQTPPSRLHPLQGDADERLDAPVHQSGVNGNAGRWQAPLLPGCLR